jgi:hypothetical protein
MVGFDVVREGSWGSLAVTSSSSDLARGFHIGAAKIVIHGCQAQERLRDQISWTIVPQSRGAGQFFSPTR